MINLCLVVIATQFSETKKRETERMRLERKRYQSSSTLASLSEPGGCYGEIVKYIAHLGRRFKRRAKRMFNLKCRTAQTRKLRKVTPNDTLVLRRNRRKLKKQQLQTVHLHHHHHHHYHHYHLAPPSPQHSSLQPPSPTHIGSHGSAICGGLDGVLAPRASPEPSEIDTLSSPRQAHFLAVPGCDVAAHQSHDSLRHGDAMLAGASDVSAGQTSCDLLPRTRIAQQNRRTLLTSQSLAEEPRKQTTPAHHWSAPLSESLPIPSSTRPSLLRPPPPAPHNGDRSFPVGPTGALLTRAHSDASAATDLGRGAGAPRSIADVLALQGAKSAAFATPIDLQTRTEVVNGNHLQVPQNTALPTSPGALHHPGKLKPFFFLLLHLL